MKIVYIKYKTLFVICLILIIIILTSSFLDAGLPGIVSVFKLNKKLLPIYSVEIPDKKISISFDAAWGSEFTDEILQILKDRDIKTTFFLVGFWVDKHPEKVKKISDEGHEIGNHSTNHPQMSKLPEDKIREELNTTADEIYQLTGKRTTLFRPPFGDYSDTLIRVAEEEGYYVIQWDVDSLDWKELGAEHTADRVLKNVKNGSIVLFHNNAKYTPKALPTILDNLLKEGYEIVPISELIYKDDYEIDHTGRQIRK
ncbi:MAG: polysaccharide deacetylase family sporulation protein PdaB [Clostridia bacterium]|nr:polysaccharide deacetylase family sporulation protein PdaB [Clostridia bacterium]